MLLKKSMASAVALGLVLAACTTDKDNKKTGGGVTPPAPVEPEPPEPYNAKLWSTDRLDLNTLEEMTVTKSESLTSGPQKSQTDVYAVQDSASELMTVSVSRNSEQPGTEPFILDMASAEWKALPRPEAPLNYLGSSNILTRDIAFFWGGEKEDGCAALGGQVFDRKKREWKDIPFANAPSPRLYADIHAYQDKLLVFGGMKTHGSECKKRRDDDSRFTVLIDGKFYSQATGTWEGDITIPQELLKDFDPEWAVSWLINKELVVRLSRPEKSRFLAMNLDTGAWKSVLDMAGGAQQIQTARLKDGLAVIHYKKSEDKEKPATLKLSKLFGEALEKSRTSEAYLPNVFNSIYVKHDAASSVGQNFLAIGLKSGDSIMDTSIQFAVDVSGPIKLRALPIFGSSLVEWLELEDGYVGFSHDDLEKVVAVYLDKKSGAMKRLGGFDIDYHQYRVLRTHKNKVFLSMGLETASNYVLELSVQQ